MNNELSQKLKEILLHDKWRMEKLEEVRSLGLNDCWIGAGFVRNKVWDFSHGFATSSLLNDVDVIYFDRNDFSRERDFGLENKLFKNESSVNWSVKNQARMHSKHDHSPYKNCEEAIGHWVETATCVAVRLTETGELELIAPHGLEDLMNLWVKPTAAFIDFPRREIYLNRMEEKQWVEKWPKLRVFL
ncbi:nucleotidyltransferase family protein [Flammeovirgaceae bacterium SG7u.111]|nr:nucleotidyltransferase family protein [Flammeovirgaceae bacterium SG7u.132]WPO35700.1 nucleotidyltransferase family protein [Flammeovirgaceae bacterium SG7u.111]